MRKHLINAVSLASLLVIGEFVASTEAHFPLPFLRGGSSSAAVATRTRTTQRRKQQRRLRRNNGIPRQLANLQQGLNKVGERIQNDASKNLKEFQMNVSREWGKFVANIPRLPSRNFNSKSGKLDEVLRTFSSVLNGQDLDTAQLLKACRAHLALMKASGASLRLVAKDLESNLQKAEALYKKSPKECQNLSSLLQMERESGIHDGNVLRDPSAAIGMLWIRRSLSFQADLYQSLTYSNGPHPRDAALESYVKHLHPYHGWALRKVFPASLTRMPEKRDLIAVFGGIKSDELNDDYEREIVKKIKALVSEWDPLLDVWRDDFQKLDLEDTRRV
mmetsp:Transcript_16371/g.34259  ORF Transcript_16371/g.34259 Transcript_16371/m.34259 type:complete len:333 (+) Transcript_16371:189-1187(+)